MIIFQPLKLLQKITPPALLRRLVNTDLTINQVAFNTVIRSGVISEKNLEGVVARVIKQYKASLKEKAAQGTARKTALKETLAGKALMVQRVQNAVVEEIAKEIKSAYRGERYVWLPSTAKEPDPLHQLLYGKKRRVGVGEMPGDRPGCRCGMKLLVDEDALDL